MSETLEAPPAAAAPFVPLPSVSNHVTLELVLEPADAALFWRQPFIAGLREGRIRASPLRLVWHDTPSGALAGSKLALVEQRLGSVATWQMTELAPRTPGEGMPAAPPRVLAEATCATDALRSAPAGLIAGPMMPVASFEGVSRRLPLGGRGNLEAVTIQAGIVRGVAAQARTCRVSISGEPDGVFTLARAATAALRLVVPRCSLAAEARALATGVEPAPRRLGAPCLPEVARPGEAFAAIIGQLTDVVLHWSTLCSVSTPEPVHQIRVALRRMRSAIRLFRPALAYPRLDEIEQGLSGLFRVLGPARDWDVFVSGLGPSLGAALPDERAITRMLAAAERQRRASYVALRAYLSDAPFRLLVLDLAELALAHPWETGAETESLQPELPVFASHALARRLRHVTSLGKNLRHRSSSELHALRKQCKRLRYTAEFLSPVFASGGARRYIRRLSELQEQLGRLNDGATAAALVRQLGSGHSGFAAGAVSGFVAARQSGARDEALRCWQQFRECERFWT